MNAGFGRPRRLLSMLGLLFAVAACDPLAAPSTDDATPCGEAQGVFRRCGASLPLLGGGRCTGPSLLVAECVLEHASSCDSLAKLRYEECFEAIVGGVPGAPIVPPIDLGLLPDAGDVPKITLENSDVACANGLDDDRDGYVDCDDVSCTEGPAVHGCGSDAGTNDDADGSPDPRDAATADAGSARGDAGPVDAGPVDAGPVDAGPVDATPRDAGSRDGGAAADAGRPGAEDDRARCMNGLDDDGDGYVDCDDFDCRASRIDVCAAEDGDAACANGLDDDGDGYVDCDDFDCSRSGRTTVCGSRGEG